MVSQKLGERSIFNLAAACSQIAQLVPRQSLYLFFPSQGTPHETNLFFDP